MAVRGRHKFRDDLLRALFGSEDEEQPPITPEIFDMMWGGAAKKRPQPRKR